MFWALLCPSSGGQDCLIQDVVMQSSNSFNTVHIAYVPAPHDHSQHNQASPRGIKQSCSPDDGHNNARNMLRVN
jgi:hypothetical protein